MGLFDKLSGKNRDNNGSRTGAGRLIAVIGVCVALTALCGLFAKQSFDAKQQNRALADSVAALQQEIDLLKRENTHLEAETALLYEANAMAGAEEPIEIAYGKAMLEWSGNTQEGVNIIMHYGDMWKAEMEDCLRLIEEELNDDKKRWVSASQEKWEVFTKDNEELAWQAYDQINHGGSIMDIHSANIYYEKYKTRALYLKPLYDFLTGKH